MTQQTPNSRTPRGSYGGNLSRQNNPRAQNDFAARQQSHGSQPQQDAWYGRQDAPQKAQGRQQREIQWDNPWESQGEPQRRSRQENHHSNTAYLQGIRADELPQNCTGRAAQRQAAPARTHATGGRSNQAQHTPPNARANANRQVHAAEASYNRSRSQASRNRAVGTTEYSDYSRYLDQRQQRRRKSPVAIGVAVALLAAIGVGVYFFLNPLSFEVTINGVTHTVDRGTTLDAALEEGMAAPQPGNLLAIDGSLLAEGGGERFSATINGEATGDGTRELKKGDVIEISNGADVTETFQTSSEEIPFERVEDENYWNGSLHVYTTGSNGIRTTKTGDVSGIQLVEETQPVVNEGYRIYNANVGEDKVIALTFDDGPWPDTTEEILDILEQYDAKATFFTIGNQIDSYSSTVKRAYDAGHQICTHTWDHASGSGQGVNLTYMSADEQVNEVQQGIAAISAVIGTEASHVMRAPGGNFFGDIIWTLQPYITAEIGWNVDTEDWRRPGVDSIVESILSVQPGDVVLMHDGGGDRSQTVEALRQALPTLKEQGYRFVTVDELLAYDIPTE